MEWVAATVATAGPPTYCWRGLSGPTRCATRSAASAASAAASAASAATAAAAAAASPSLPPSLSGYTGLYGRGGSLCSAARAD
eukprot:scaffold55706_cov32-Phaeocystis_antarctica.AAC.1